MATLYDIGDQPTLTATFADADGAAADPSAITFSLKAPDGTVTTATEADATNPAVGVWKWPIPAAFDAPGPWHFRAEATAGLQTAEELSVRVRPSNVVAG
jgi:hypothetical protein